MIAPAWDETELLARFARACDGLADAADMERLGERLENDARARQLWLEYAGIHGGITQHLDAGATLVDWPAVFAAAQQPPPAAEMYQKEVYQKPAAGAGRIVALAHSVARFMRSYPLISCAVAAVAVTLGITVLWLVTLPERGPRLAGDAGDLTFVARLTDALQPQWLDGQIGGEVGAHLQAGHLYRLQTGMAEITFRSGARVVLEGPAEFRVESENSGTLLRGKLAACVSKPARGFVVETQRGRVIDLGTRFAIDLSENGTMQLHCFRGEIVWEAPAHAALRLAAGQAIEADGRGRRRIDADARAFVHELRLRGELQRDRRGLVIDGRFAHNAALGKQATQSSTELPYTPERAIDGDPTNFTHTATDDAQAWLTVDLGELHDIDAVVLHNRDSCCGERLRDIVVEILAEDGKQVVFASAKLNEGNQLSAPPLLALGLPEVTGDAVRGRYVRIRRIATASASNDYQELADRRVLALGEVQIFATPLAAAARADDDSTASGPP